MKRLHVSKGPWILPLAAAAWLSACRIPTDAEEAGPKVLAVQRSLMGTLWEIKVVLPSQEQEEEARKAIEAAYGELERIEAVMSEWRPDSPLSRLNAAAGEGFVEVPEELAAIIRRGVDYGELTEGAFDITWLALRPIWHFDETFRVPTRQEVLAALRFVDYRQITVDGSRVALPKGFAVGLGGIAKGYAIDRAAAVLRAAGFQDFLVNGGGDIYVAGDKGGRPWVIGVRDPRGAPDRLVARLEVQDAAVVTSGDYERFLIVDGARYHHIIDPRTGWPAQACRSVTILAPEAERADVLATAVFVLGPGSGLELIQKLPGTEAFIIDREGKWFSTAGFRALAEFADGGDGTLRKEE
ncbi:MAG: FAD:protein FMN transferase [Acidobacteriota bacterium]